MKHDPVVKEQLKALFAKKLKGMTLDDVFRLTKVNTRVIQYRLYEISDQNPRKIDILIRLAAVMELNDKEINLWLSYYGKSSIEVLRSKFPSIGVEEKRSII